MGASGDTRPRGRREETAGTRGGVGWGRSPELLAAGVYGSRPLGSLREAVADVLDLRAGSGGWEEPDAGLELAHLWARPELYARLVQAAVEHAAPRRAGSVAALGVSGLPLASSVALSLRVPLGLRQGGEARPGEPTVERPYLVAGLLGPPEAVDAAPANAVETGRAVGALAVVRIGGRIGIVDDDNILSIIRLQ